ncbi:MAG: glycosyltransferase [Alphaproteobacteria bacterium]|nr:glycosyltransferase [Alphaproteobacteria bacterium]
MNDLGSLSLRDNAAILAGREQTPPLDIRHIIIGHCKGHPLQANGVYTVARQFVREQLGAGESAKLFYLRNGPAEPGDQPIDVPSQILPLNGVKLRGHAVTLAPKVMGALLAGTTRNTIFHVHGGREPLLLYLTAMLRKRHVPYALTVHGRYSHIFDQHARITRRVPALYLRVIERQVLQHAQFVHAACPQEREIVKVVAPGARVEIVGNAAYSSRLDGAPASPRRAGPSAQFPRFGFCGRYEVEHKGLDLLIEGFAAYRKAGGKGQLELIGTGPARESLAVLAGRLQLDESITVRGPAFGAEKARALNTWDFFVMPSRFDVMPTAGLEAALFGLPLIVSAPTNLQDEVNRFGSGLPISALSPAAVARALFQAEGLRAEEWARMSHAAFQMAASIGDWSVASDRLLDLYQRRDAGLRTGNHGS